MKLGYFLKPHELFSELGRKGNSDTESESNYIIEDLQVVMNHIVQSTMGTESEDDFIRILFNIYIEKVNVMYIIQFF